MKNLERIRDIMAHHSFDGLVIVPGPNMEYLTGSKFHLSERPVVLFIEKDTSTFILPELESPKISNLGFDYITYNDEEGYELGFSKFNHKIEKLGVESRLIRHIELDIISAKDISTNIHDATDIFATLRMPKSSTELELMAEAVSIAEMSIMSILDKIKPGVTEKEFASELVIQLLRNGSLSELPFSPIVASGVNAANPHHYSGDKEFKEDELIIIDWGANYKGYFSDITRTFAIGKNIDSKLLEAYDAVKLANESARNVAKVGVKAGDVDSAARKIIEDAGFGQYFTHRTGHGLGLEIHEEPYIKPDSSFILEKGMTFTIEPGIYIPDLGGIRIEDDVYLSDSDSRSLTSLPRSLQYI